MTPTDLKCLRDIQRAPLHAHQKRFPSKQIKRLIGDGYLFWGYTTPMMLHAWRVTPKAIAEIERASLAESFK